MSREIKFRVWDKDYSVMKNDSYAKKILSGFKGNYARHFDIMQYTGLKDKDGKEIWEGDIVKGYHPNGDAFYYKVEWDDYYCGFKPFAEYDADCDDFTRGEDVEVIGNIHENPELLEAKDEIHS